jgi:hypothetical protein
MTASTLRPLVLALVAASLVAQERPKLPPAPGGAPATNGAPKVEGPKPPTEGEPKPYDKVITPELKSQQGLFLVHTGKAKVYFEIPKEQLGKDLLVVVQVKKSPADVSYPGQSVGDEVVRWELRDNKVLLKAVPFSHVADPANPVAKAVAAMSTPGILMSFPVEAFSKEGAPVIEVTRLFTSEVNEFSAKRALQATGMDASRSYIDKVKAFPLNLNVEAVQTFNPNPVPLPPGIPPQYAAMIPPPPTRTAVVHYSFVQLPEKPMMGRLKDDRVGFFSHGHTDYSRPEHEVTTTSFIARWRLEKKDPAAAKSEPVKPIIFYVDPATPKAWVPFVKQGIEAWKGAFEEAGFLNAIQAKEAPSREQDPDWSADDARHSVVRWVPSRTANAMGPHVSDPRSGEILEADIEIYQNILQLQTDWYFTQVGPLDKRVATLPMPDELMGELLAYVVTHEVGHSLGLPHNFKASATYPVDKLRDKAWLEKMGHVATLMDYSRFNYLAQPEDGLDPKLLIPKIGPYDTFAIKWGYTPIPEAKTPDAEKPTLDAWCKPQETTPWLRFSTAGSMGSDPGDQAEAVGDMDAVKATALGTKNLKRVVEMLPKASLKPGEDFDKLNHLYGATLGQWGRELGHVANVVGGFDSEPKVGLQPGVRFTPLAKARQAEAVKFINENLFKTPSWALPQDLLRKLEPTSGQVRLVNLQRGVLNALLNPSRLTRLQEQEAILGDKAYTVHHLLGDLRTGICAELVGGGRIDAYRRNLQRAYVDLLGARLVQAAPAVTMPGGPAPAPVLANDDTRGAVRAELKALMGLAAARAAAGDRATKAHLEDLKDQISRLLDPRGAQPTGAGAPPAPMRGLAPDSCWPEVAGN